MLIKIALSVRVDPLETTKPELKQIFTTLFTSHKLTYLHFRPTIENDHAIKKIADRIY